MEIHFHEDVLTQILRDKLIVSKFIHCHHPSLMSYFKMFFPSRNKSNTCKQS